MKKKPVNQPFDGNITELVKEMERLSHLLGSLPDNQGWTQEQLGDIDDIRHAALELAHEAEMTIKVFEGIEKGKEVS